MAATARPGMTGPVGRSVVALLVATIASSSCGGNGNANPDGSADGSSDSFATTAGASVLVPSVTKIVARSLGGGFGILMPPGAACERQVWMYGLDLGTAQLSWSRCDVAGNGTNAADYTPAMGMRTLSTGEMDDATAAIREVRVSAGTSCGADKGSVTFEVISAASNLIYGDEFYACLKQYEHYIEYQTVDHLAAVLLPLAR